MLTDLKQQINSRQTEALFTETSCKETELAVQGCNEEILSEFKKYKNLPDVYEQLPHHCVQLCFLS